MVIYTCFESEEKKAPTMKDSMNACMELIGFSTSNKVKNHWFIEILKLVQYTLLNMEQQLY